VRNWPEPEPESTCVRSYDGECADGHAGDDHRPHAEQRRHAPGHCGSEADTTGERQHSESGFESAEALHELQVPRHVVDGAEGAEEEHQYGDRGTAEGAVAELRTSSTGCGWRSSHQMNATMPGPRRRPR